MVPSSGGDRDRNENDHGSEAQEDLCFTRNCVSVIDDRYAEEGTEQEFRTHANHTDRVTCLE